MILRKVFKNSRFINIVRVSALIAVLMGTSVMECSAERSSFNFSDYNYKDFRMPFSSSRLVTLADIREQYPYGIDLARNEILARKGYIFKTQEYSSYFTQMSWYTPDAKYSESLLNQIEKKNITILQQYAEKLKKNLLKPGVKSAAVDLNGDGKKDNIKLACSKEADSFTLNINGKTIKGNGDNLEGIFYICDMNNADKLKEIAVTEMGPSDDYMTAFYFYDGKSIKFMGKMEGAAHSLLIDGSGIVTTKTRGEILHTWYYSDSYKLDAGHKLVHIPKNSHLMNTMVTVIKPLALKKSTTDNSTSITLKAGEKVLIVSTDNKKWCKVMNSKGQTGWFSISDFYKIDGTEEMPDKYFDGLIFAD